MIILDENTKSLVQGITGKQGTFHTQQMVDYGTNIVAGVTPGRGGQKIGSIEVYDSVEAVSEEMEVNASIIFVPAPFAKDAAFEAISLLDLVVIITEHIPVHDSMQIMEYARKKDTIVVGPNTPGIISPEVGKLGIMPSHIFQKGDIGIVSRSGTLTYEFAHQISRSGNGQSTSIGIGGDPVVGLDFATVLEKFENDPKTRAIVMIGEIGGNAEEEAARYIQKNISKPVIAFVAGATAPPGKRMGHAGAIIEGEAGTAESKMEALEEVGVQVVEKPSDVATVIKRL